MLIKVKQNFPVLSMTAVAIFEAFLNCISRRRGDYGGFQGGKQSLASFLEETLTLARAGEF